MDGSLNYVVPASVCAVNSRYIFGIGECSSVEREIHSWGLLLTLVRHPLRKGIGKEYRLLEEGLVAALLE